MQQILALVQSKDAIVAAFIAAVAGALWLYQRGYLTGWKWPAIGGGETKSDAAKAFAELQSLLAFAKGPAGCPEMTSHLNAAGRCLFGHDDHGPNPPAAETTA